MNPTLFRVFAALAILGVLGGCAQPRSPVPLTTRLVDLYKPEMTEGRVPPTEPPPRTEWRFDGPAPASADKLPATRGWEAVKDVSGLAIRDGRLVGKATADFPLIHIEQAPGTSGADIIHEVQVRLTVSSGGNLSVGFVGSEKLELAGVLEEARAFPWDTTTPVVAGDRTQTYTVRSQFSIPMSQTRHILVRPTDRAGAAFAIESVRLVSRAEHMASVPSGIGWQGLSEVYKETLVARSPETLKVPVALRPQSWLDLAVGTVEDGPVTFRVSARRAGSSEGESMLLERTVTRAHRWEAAPVDLGAFGGREVTLSLAVAGEKPGTLGFWGAPTVRTRAALPAPTTPQKAPFPAPQGVILVWADTLRRDHLGVYGYGRPTSPVLDRLAAEGTLFRDCVGQASWTKVATPSLLTSLYPTSHTVHDFYDRLPSSAVTLAEAYREAGYATLSLSSVLFTGKFTNLHQGFEEVHEDGSLPERGSSKTAREYVDRLTSWLEGHRDVPFFVFLHVTDPHDPYKPRPPYDTLWADGAKAAEHERHNKEVRKSIADPLMKAFGMPNRAELVAAKIDPDAYVDYDRGWYDGSIRAMDAEMGRLVQRLQALGLDRKTLVVVTADHGEEFLEHGRMFHGQTVYGEQNNMPLILWGPTSVPPGRVVEETVQTIDVMPTLLEASRLPVPAAAQGQSLWPLVSRSSSPGAVRAAEGTERPAVSEKAATTTASGAPPPRDTESTAIVWGEWKLIHNTKRAASHPEYELYDHGKDPLDSADVAGQHPDVVQRLAERLNAWRRMAAAGQLKGDAETSQQLSKEELERLRSLGYIQ